MDCCINEEEKSSYYSKNSGQHLTINSTSSSRFHPSDQSKESKPSTEEAKKNYEEWRSTLYNRSYLNALPEFEETKAQRDTFRQKNQTKGARNAKEIRNPFLKPNASSFSNTILKNDEMETTSRQRKQRRKVAYSWLKLTEPNHGNNKRFKCFKEDDIWPKRSHHLNEIVD